MVLSEIVNGYGLLFAVISLVPHIVYMRTHTLDTSAFTNRGMVYIDRIGRFFSLFLMAFQLHILEQGFPEPKALMERFWLIVMGVCSLLYVLLWLLFFKRESRGTALSLIMLTAFMVMLSGLLQVKTLLLTAGVVWLIGDLYLFSRYFKNRK